MMEIESNEGHHRTKRSKREISGIIHNLSPVIEYTNGYTRYINVISNDNHNYYIVLIGEKCLHYISILTVGFSYTFKNIERSNSIVDTITSSSSSSNDLSNYWLVANDKCEIIKQIKDEMIAVNIYTFDQLLSTYLDFLEPSIANKSIYENIEINITGYIDEVCPCGVIKLVKSLSSSFENESNRANGVKQKLTTFNVFLTNNHVKAHANSLDATSKGEVATFFSLFPMYLWGNFVGFATSIRSHIQIDSLNTKTHTTKRKSAFYNDANLVKNKCPLVAAWMLHLYQHLNSMKITAYVANNILEKYACISQDNYQPNERREFADAWYTQLYYIRSGNDSDGLSSKLPLLWNPSKDKLLSIYQSKFDTIQSVKSWKVCKIESPCERTSSWEMSTGMSRKNILVANIVDVISHKNPTVNCTLIRICNKPSVASMITIIIGDNNKLRNLNAQLSQLTVQASDRKIIMIEHYAILHEVQPVELHESLKSMKRETYMLAQVENVTLISSIDHGMIPEHNNLLSSNYLLEQKMYSVRHALLRRPHCADVPLPMLVGIVIQKVLIGNCDCYLLLRDLVDCDTMTITMKADEACNIILGLIISIKNSKISSVSDCITYKYDSKLKNSRIDIIGIDSEQYDLINADLIERFPMQSYYTGNAKKILPRVPPRYRLSSMYTTKNYNRCTWTFLGQVTFVKMFGISLKCQKCFAGCIIQNDMHDFECIVCHGRRHLFPTWEAEVVFDDGSAECHLFVEGDDVFKLLEPESLQMRNKLLRLKDIVESLAFMHGSIYYTSDSVVINRQKKVSKEWSEDALSEKAFGNNDEYQKLIETTDWTYNFIKEAKKKTNTKNDEDAIDAIKGIRNIQKLRPIIEICARLKMTNKQPYLRNIKLQKDNTTFVFFSIEDNCRTLSNNHIEMICYSVKTITRNETNTEAYQILSLLN